MPKAVQPPTQVTAEPPAAAAAPAGTIQELKVSAHMMSLPSGLFSITHEGSPAALANNGLPGVRISAPPGVPNAVEIVGFRTDGWLSAEGDAALVRVRKGPVQLLVTIYQLAGQPDLAPKLEVRQLLTVLEAAPQGPLPAVSEPVASDASAHIQTRGDISAAYGAWVGEPGSNLWIEGFTLQAPAGIAPGDLSYQAVLGRGWLSPWVEAGEYCGSRGMAMPVQGLRVRLSGEAAERYVISVTASFVGGAKAGPVGNEETCEAETLAPLEAFMVSFTPRLRKTGKTKR